MNFAACKLVFSLTENESIRLRSEVNRKCGGFDSLGVTRGPKGSQVVPRDHKWSQGVAIPMGGR